MTFAIKAFRTDDIVGMESARRIRDVVFCGEQGVSAEIEWDGKDPECEHFLLENNGEPIGTARVSRHGPSVFKVERVAVLKHARGLGAGKAIMLFILDRMESTNTVVLNAQIQVEDFYEQLGFTRNGESFEEAGIPHVPMIWQP